MLQRQVNKGVAVLQELTETDAEASHHCAVSYVPHQRMVQKASGRLFRHPWELGKTLRCAACYLVQGGAHRAPCAPGKATSPPPSILNPTDLWPLPGTSLRVHWDRAREPELSAATCPQSLHASLGACQGHSSPRDPSDQVLSANLTSSAFRTHPELATSHHLCHYHLGFLT